MLYHGAQRVKRANLSNISRLLSLLAIFLRFQAFQRYMISDVVFSWKVDSNFGHFAATLLGLKLIMLMFYVYCVVPIVELRFPRMFSKNKKSVLK